MNARIVPAHIPSLQRAVFHSEDVTTENSPSYDYANLLVNLRLTLTFLLPSLVHKEQDRVAYF